MDERLKELKARADAGDMDAKRLFLSELINSGEALDIEYSARLGDQIAIRQYLEILDFRGIVDLQNMWVMPFMQGPYDLENSYENWPYDTDFLPSIPFTLSLDVPEI